MKITVNDGTNPIEGATVSVDSTDVTTDADGVAEFELDYGDYEATITADNFFTKTEQLVFRSNHKNFTVTLESAIGNGTVTVTIIQEESKPEINSALVLLRTDDDFVKAPNTDGTVGWGAYGNSALTLKYVDQTHIPTQSTDIPFGVYYLCAYNSLYNEDGYAYVGELIVNGNKEVTITLTEQ